MDAANTCDLNQLNSEFPCDQRKGYGWKGCKCGGGKSTEVDTNYIDCGIMNLTRWQQCINCAYQREFLKK